MLALGRSSLTTLFFLAPLTACTPGSATPDDSPSDDTMGSDTPSESDTPDETDDTTPNKPDALAQNLRSGAGSWALDYLRDDPYTKLIVEIDYVEGNRPKASVPGAIKKVLAALGRKPDGVEVIIDDAVPDPAVVGWTTDDLDAIETAHRDRFRDPEAGVAVIWMFWADDRSKRDTDSSYILGTAYHGSSLVMYPKNIAKLDSGLPLGGLFKSEPQDIVAAHELGHLLGLVNNGIAMAADHQDAEHGAHDSNNECLMHWSIEGQGLGDVLASRVPTFDNACLDDVETAGGRTRAEARTALSR